MKKSYLWSVLAAGVLLSASCSKEDELSKEEGDDTAQVLTINIASGGDGLTARSGRPLYGSNADQSIENVQVFIYNEADQNKIVYAKAIDTWDTSSAVYDDPTLGTVVSTRFHSKEMTSWLMALTR